MSNWQFRPLNPNENSGLSTVDDNFANEERTSVEIFVRETLQNPLDARKDKELVEVSYSLVSVKSKDSKVLKKILSPDCLGHFKAGRLIETEEIPEVVDFLIVEDFGTTGLEGSYTDSTMDGRSENWNAFWFREGEGAKPTKSNGGAGQGKITLYAASEIRSVFALTKRSSDGGKLLFGCCRFKQNYKLLSGGERWAKEARWGGESDPNLLAVPLIDIDVINVFEEELNLKRKNRAGTSFIVPMPTGITLLDLKRAVVNEFFFPIRRGRLNVSIGDEVLDHNSIVVAAKELGSTIRYPADYRKFLERSIENQVDSIATAAAKTSWSQTSKLLESSFDANEIIVLKERFEKSEIVSVDFPVKVRKKSQPITSSKFRVVLQQYLEGDESHELFIRQDLCIDGEKRLKGSRRTQPVLALTFIEDTELSSFLTAAEEPTHRTWNSKRPKVISQYEKTTELLSLVRNAALRLVELLTPPGKRDNAALALYFADPESLKEGIKGERGNKPDEKNPAGKVVSISIPAKKRPFDFIPLKDGFSIRAIYSEALSKVPILCEVHTAYATTYGDPFKQWDAAEFWLNDEKEFFVSHAGISELTRDGNILRFRIDDPDGSLTVAGFDSHRKVEVKINYSEQDNAEDIENN